jgi:hypothetical protein
MTKPLAALAAVLGFFSRRPAAAGSDDVDGN